MIQISEDAKKQETQVKLTTINDDPRIPSKGEACVAIDDVIITSSTDLPKSFYDDFDYENKLNWLWKSNGEILVILKLVSIF